MRCIIIDPANRRIYEQSRPMSADFMTVIARDIGADTLGLDVAPPHTAMFLDAIGFLRPNQSFWRRVGDKPQNNVAGVAVMFGLAPDGKLADLPPEITLEALRAQLVWVDDVIEQTIERMEIVQHPNGLAPRVHRQVIWRPGAVIPANGIAPAPEGAQIAQEALQDAYAPSAATPAAAKAPEAAPGAPLAPVWAIHETADNRYRVIEYEVTAAGLGSPLSLATVQNIDEARARVPKGLMMRPADDDVADDTLVETWS